MAGVTVEGFLTKTLDELKTELEDALKASFGASIDVDPQSNFGQLIGVMAERFSDLWALGAAIDNAFNPDSASGIALDNLAGLTGTVRNPATFSEVTLTLTGDDSVEVLAGSAASVLNIASTRFVLTNNATLADPGAWAPTTGYVVGDRVHNGGTVRVYQCITSGTSAGSGGPTTTSANITDGTAHWKYLGDGAAVVDAPAVASVAGPKVGAAGTVTVIETPAAGWSNVTNLLDADVGNDIETDAALRVRREVELRGAGKASLEAIRAALLEVPDVTEATVFENVTNATDGDGVPPHAVECLVRGGTAAAIEAAIFSELAAGIYPHGTTSGTVTDSQGLTHTIRFTRPSEQTVYIDLTITVDADLFPTDGADQAEALIVAWGNGQKSGKDVVASGIEAQVFALPGVLDVVALIKLTAVPTVRTTIAISSRQLAVFDTGRIGTTITPGTP